jgi:hypothetical protein
MPSRLLETYPAHILRSITSSGLWNRLILSVVPLDDFKDARKEIVSLYAEVYAEVDEVRESFSEKSNPQLREWAVEPYSRIPEYDPHETVTRLLSFPAKLMGWFKQLSTVIAVVGSLLSANWLRTLGTGGLDVIEGIEGLLPLSFIAVSIVYLWFLHVDTRAHQTYRRGASCWPGESANASAPTDSRLRSMEPFASRPIGIASRRGLLPARFPLEAPRG